MQTYKRGFNIKDSGNAFLTGWLAMWALQLILSMLFAKNATLLNMSVIIGNQIAFIAASFAYCRKRRIDFIGEIGLKKKPNLKQVLLLIPIAIFAIGAFLPLATWFVNVLTALGYKTGSSAISETSGYLAFSIFFLCVFPAIGEELFVRGAVMTGLKNRSYTFAIFASAALFSIMHGSALQTVHQFGLGLILAYVVIVTGDIKTCMILHFLNNFISVISDVVFSQLNAIEFAWWQVPVGLVCVFVSLIALIVLLKKFTSISRDNKKETTVFDGEVVEVTEIFPEGKLKYQNNLIKQAFSDFFAIFKKGGLKRQLALLNEDLAEISPLRPAEETESVFANPDMFGLSDNFSVERDTAVPASLKLSFIAVALIWLLSTAMQFIGV